MTAIARVVLRLGVTAFLFLFPLSLLAAESVRFKPGVWTESRQPGEQVVKGALFLPSGAPPYPAVVLLPHCGGFKSTNVQRVWPDFLTDSGYAVLTVDSYGPQGQQNCVGLNKAESHPLQADFAYGALDFLASRTDIKRDRIAAIGFSDGAFVLNNNITPGSGNRSRNPEFKAAVSFYGGCRMLHRHVKEDIPMMIIAPEHDSQLSPLCIKSAIRSDHIYLHVLMGAYHAFDEKKHKKMTADAWGNKMLYSSTATSKARGYIKEFLDHFIGPKAGTMLVRKIDYKGSEGARSELDTWISTNKQNLCSGDIDDFADGVFDKIDGLKSKKKITQDFTVSKFKMKRLFKDTCS